MGFISHHEIEQRLIGNRMRTVVMREFGVRDRFRQDAEVGFYFLVYSFCFIVGLRVIGSGEG